MDLREAERRILQVLARDPLSPRIFIVSAPLGLPVESWFQNLQKKTARRGELRAVIRLRQLRRVPAFYAVQKIAAEIRKAYPDTWASVTEHTPLAAPFTTPAPEISREEGFRWLKYIAQILAWFAVDQPLKVYISQLEHADPWSLRTLEYLMNHLITTPLQVFATWKPPPQVLGTPLASGILQGQIHLLPVDLPSERELFNDWQERVPDAGALRYLIRLTHRRPLALRQILKALDTGATLTEAAAQEWVETVPRILDSQDQAVLYLLQRFSEGLTLWEIRNLLRLSHEVLSHSLSYLNSLGLLFQDRGYLGTTLPRLPLPKPAPRFFHAGRVHSLRYAEVQRAQFLEEIGFPDEAVQYWVRAAQKELARGRLSQALRYLDRAEGLARDPLPLLRKRLLWLLEYQKLDEARRIIRNLDPEKPLEFLTIKEVEARYRPIPELLQEVEAYLEQHPDPSLRLLAARFALDIHDLAKAHAHLSQVQESDFTTLKEKSKLWDLWGRYYTYERDFSRARRCYQKMQDIVESLEQPEYQAVLYNNLAGFFLYQGKTDQARYYLDLARETAGRIGYQNLYRVAIMNQFLLFERALRFLEARQILFETMKRPWFHHAPPHTRLTVLGNLVLILFRLGEFEQAVHLYRKIHPHYLEHFPLLLLDPAETCIHALYVLERDPKIGEAILADFRTRAERGPDFSKIHRQLLRYLEGLLMVARGDFVGGLKVYEEVLQEADPRHCPYLVFTVRGFRAEALILSGRLQEGRKEFNELLEETRQRFPQETPFFRYLKVWALVRRGEIPLHEIESLEQEFHQLRAFGFAQRVRALLPEAPAS